MTSSAQILLNIDDHLVTSNRGFFYKMCGVLRNTKFLLPFLPAEIKRIKVTSNTQTKEVQVVSKITDSSSDNVLNYQNYLQFHESHLNQRFEIDAWSQNRTLNWNWFINTESMLANYKKRLDFSICSGLNVYKENGTHNMIITPGMINYDNVLHTTPEVIVDMRPDISNIPPRGSMLKVFFIGTENVEAVREDMTIYDFSSITIFLNEGEKKEMYDHVISERILQMTDSDHNSISSYLEVARVWIKDCLHCPPTLEVSYDLQCRRPNFLNWSI